MKFYQLKRHWLKALGLPSVVAFPILTLACDNDANEDVDIKSAKAILSEANSTILSGKNFAELELKEQALGEEAILSLGMLIKTLPTNIGVLVAKEANSFVVKYKISNANSLTINHQVVFVHSDTDDQTIAQTLGSFVALSRSERTIDEFNNVEISLPTALDDMTKQKLGLGYFNFDPSVYVRVSKQPKSSAFTYYISCGLGQSVESSAILEIFAPAPIPQAATEIASNQFTNAYLPQTFVIPSSVTTIRTNAFKGAILPIGFRIPTTVTTIEVNAFEGVIFKDKDPRNGYRWINDDGTGEAKANSFVGRYIVPAGTSNIANNQFRNQVIPAGSVVPRSVIKIGTSAFEKATLVAIANGVPGFIFEGQSSLTEIGDYAFSGVQGIDSAFVLPNTLNKLGVGVFASTTIPRTFVLPPLVTEISEATFRSSVFEEGFNIPDTVIKIGDYAFETTILPTSFSVPLPTVNFGKGVFRYSVLPHGFTLAQNALAGSKDIPMAFFEGAALPVGFRLFNNAEIVNEKSFRGASLASDFILPNSIKIIFNQAFEQTNLPKDFTLPSSLEEIKENAFRGVDLRQLNDFRIPDTIKLLRLSFVEAFLNVGFKIPMITDVTFDKTNNPFKDAIIPYGYKWSIVIDDVPQPGSEIIFA